MNEEEKKMIKKFVEKYNKFDESVEIKGVSVGEEYRILETVCKTLDLADKLQKENELAKKQVEYDKTHIYTPQTIKLNYIPIQTIEDKIEDLKMSGGSDRKDNTENTARELVIEALQDILDESKEE